MSDSTEMRLKGFGLFEGFAPEETRAMIQCGRVTAYSAQEVLFREGDPADAVMLVLSGRLEVFVSEGKASPRVLAEAGPGRIVGEVAVLHRVPRSAGVRAAEPATGVVWSAAAFRKMMGDYPELSRRVRGESIPQASSGLG
jgi:CRP-like cAMP-binding protein